MILPRRQTPPRWRPWWRFWFWIDVLPPRSEIQREIHKVGNQGKRPGINLSDVQDQVPLRAQSLRGPWLSWRWWLPPDGKAGHAKWVGGRPQVAARHVRRSSLQGSVVLRGLFLDLLEQFVTGLGLLVSPWRLVTSLRVRAQRKGNQTVLPEIPTKKRKVMVQNLQD